MNQDEIRIIAEPLTMASCRFTVDRPVYAQSSFYFDNAERAAGSPLAKRLFEVPGVASVLIAHDQVTINKEDHEQWQVIGGQIGAIIREHLQSGEEVVSEELRASLPPASEIRAKVEQILETQINPMVASHGGSIRLLDVKDNNVFIEMGGGCQGCASASITLKQGVETAIRRSIPEVGGIFDATDHAAGQNPYYTAQ